MARKAQRDRTVAAKVFLSFSGSHEFLARQLHQRLESEHIPAYLDHAHIRVGDDIWRELAWSISQCSHLVLLWSRAANRSEWVQRELAFALKCERKGGTPRILPLICDECPLPTGLQGRRYLDSSQGLDGVWDELLGRLTRDIFGITASRASDADWTRGLHGRAQRGHRRLASAHVLIVNDYPETMHLTTAVLRRHGVSISETTTTDEALRILRKQDVDVVISDMRRGGIPDEGQRFLVRAIREGLHRPTIFSVYRFEPERGVPPYAFGIADNHQEIVHLCIDVLERPRYWRTFR